MGPDRRRLLTFVCLGVAFGLLATTLVIYFDRGVVPGDAFTYLAAGERLNAGHPLYALSPGDRIVDYHPPYWTVPLLSPPLIAVLFRPFALLSDAGAYVWWIGTMTAIAVTLVVFARRVPIQTSIAVIVLGIPLTYELAVGNVNGLLIAGSAAAWYTATRGHERTAGAIVAFLVMVKVWPITLAWWLVVQHRWVAVRVGVVAGVALAVVSLVGAGLDAHLAYVSVIRDTAASGTSVLSVPGMARFIGVPAGIALYLGWVVFFGGCALTWLLRGRPAWSFAFAIVAMTLGSAVVNINWFALFLVLLAPIAWPVVEPSAVVPSAVEHPGESRPPAAVGVS
jgi:hypothetical protein